MKTEIPNYTLDALIRHVEWVCSHCRADPSDVKTNESLRLLKSDITKINRLKNEKSKRKTEEEK